MSEYPLEKIRSDFPILQRDIYGKPLVYLDNAASTLKPKPVVDVLSHYYLLEASNVHRGAHFLSDTGTRSYEQAREKVRRFLNAKQSSEIIFTRGTTESLNLVAQSYARENLGLGDGILISEMEHHSNIVPWQMICQERGCKLNVIPVLENGELDLSAFKQLLSPKVKLVSVVHTSNALGTINPIREIIKQAHSAGAKVVIDAAQAVSNQKIDVQDLDCDFLAFSGHKIFGPYGIGVLYGKAEILETMPPYQGGGSMIEDVTFAKTSYLHPPHRFEAGTPAISGALGLASAIDYVQSIGLESIHFYEAQLLHQATHQLKQIPGLRVIGEAKPKASILSFIMDGAHPSDFGSLLDREGIAVRTGHHCCQPLMRRFGISGTIRASFSIYNSFADVERLITALDKARRILHG